MERSHHIGQGPEATSATLITDVTLTSQLAPVGNQVHRRGHSLAVQTSVSLSDAPQAAVVGIVLSNRFEIFFDTAESSRKVSNLKRDPKIAFVIGGLSDGDERTIQYEGVADEPGGADLQRLKKLYFKSLPDGREREGWPGIICIRARPKWIRYSDYNQDPPAICEFNFR